MPNIVYKKQPDGTYKKIVLVEKTISGKLQFVNEYDMLVGSNGVTGSQGDQGIQGPVGPQGLQGIPGIDGIQGPVGPQGLQGIPGIDGIQGPVGPQGLQGIPGENGYTPVKGVDYFDGVQGPVGPQGLQGIPGKNGKQGVQGLQGIPGKDGEKGERGEIGPRGFIGLQGATGPAGATGPQGKPGPKGDRGPAGMGAAGRGISSTSISGGDLYITYTDGSTVNVGAVGGGSSNYSEVKNGLIIGPSFSLSTDYIYCVTFSTPYTYSGYVVSICGEDPRTWSISNKTVNGFIVKSNSSSSLTGSVYWMTSYGSGDIQSNNRRGIVANTSWYGTMRKTDILFIDPLSSSYSVVVTGEDPRTWSVENISLTGFTINSNSSEDVTYNTYWQCIEI